MKRHKLEVPQTPCSCGVCVWLQAFRRAGGRVRSDPGMPCSPTSCYPRATPGNEATSLRGARRQRLA